MTGEATAGRGGRSTSRRVMRVIGIRVVVWGGVILLTFLAVGDIRSIVAPNPSSRTTTPASHEAPSESAGWPHLRGPEYSGISRETGLVEAWPEEGPPVLWLRHLGEGYSGIVAVGDRVFTQTQTAFGQSVLCLDAQSGDTVWQYRYGWPYDHAGSYPGPRSTPTWHAGRIYFAAPRGLIGCLQADDGRLVWSVNILEKFGDRGIDFGYAASPLVDEKSVILPAGGEGASLVALDARDGSTLWATGDEPASFGSAIPVTVEDRRLVAVLLRNVLVLADAKSGELLFQDVLSKGYDEHATFPLYTEPYLMVTSAFRAGSKCYRLEPADPAEDSSPVRVTPIFSSPKMSNDVVSSVVVDGYVYGFDLRDIQSKAYRPSRGAFTCMELETGEILWTTERTGHASVIVADNKLVLFNDQGQLVLVRATPTGYDELARTQVFRDETCWTAPALHRGRLYLRSPSRAACLFLGDPARLGTRCLQSAATAAEVAGARKWDLKWLLGGRRAPAADRPTARSLRQWYWLCLVAGFLPGAVAAVVLQSLARIKWPGAAKRIGYGVFWSVTSVSGVAATAVLNRDSPELVFTWPVSLFVAHQAALIAIVWSQQPERGRHAWCVGATAGLAFWTACLVYLQVCRMLGLVNEWVFLAGLPVSWPVAIPIAYRLRTARPLYEHIGWGVACFTAYFLGCVAVFAWVTR